VSDQKLVLDAARCDGHGICALRCPDRVSLDQWGFAVIDSAPLVGRRLVRRARAVVAACPNDALSLSVVPGTPAPTPGGSK
jgi:ferredoxin